MTALLPAPLIVITALILKFTSTMMAHPRLITIVGCLILLLSLVLVLVVVRPGSYQHSPILISLLETSNRISRHFLADFQRQVCRVNPPFRVTRPCGNISTRLALHHRRTLRSVDARSAHRLIKLKLELKQPMLAPTCVTRLLLPAFPVAPILITTRAIPSVPSSISPEVPILQLYQREPPADS